ncbi:transposase [Paraburkholderia terricola]|uniref:IS110 family transposase n=1 Tax=Paraburkholderia terricola TaxID=169427 RepID=UPI00285AD724|nr:IS110 family transposase [Paraburkholderia terricola]MDR6495982.1 transposase [Paraburkholderia terricola]
MNEIVRVGVDLAKNVMQIHGVDRFEKVVVRKALPRGKFLEWFANRPPCIVAMESCSTANFWGRKLRAMGHDVRLIAPQFAAPYRKGGAAVKNDAQDAAAICEAASRPNMRYVGIKTADQQGTLVMHRMRAGYVEERTALVNRLRGLLVEFGVFLPQGITKFRSRFVESVEDATNDLTGTARIALLRAAGQLRALDDEIDWLDRSIVQHAREDVRARRVMEMFGVGPLTASAATATVADARQFRNGRQFAAWLGLVPKQNSSGGKDRLGRITKQGNAYLRTLLCQCARVTVTAARNRQDRLSRWIVQLQARAGNAKTLVAVANKHARVLWAVMAREERFDPDYATKMQAGRQVTQ